MAQASTVLTLRIDRDLQRSLESEARRRQTSKSELVRQLLTAGLGAKTEAARFAEEARRQSLLVSERESEKEVLDFLEEVTDTRGWS